MGGHDAELILIGGALLAAGLGAALVADRVRVPGLLLFLGLGMLLGSDGIGGIEFDDAELARTLGTVGLVLILFEGGLTAGWREIRPVLGVAVGLATLGTFLTAMATGGAAILLFDLTTLEGLILGAAVAATDSAAIFAVLRGSRLERRLARTLEGESGLNDPVALLLVVGFGEWILNPGYGAVDMALEFAAKLSLGAVLGLAIGWLARDAIRRIELPTEGLYPVATIAVAALSYGVTEVLGGSGFLAVYVAALMLGTGSIPARRTVVAFHQGLSWLVQISLFFALGLLVFPSELLAIAPEGLLLSVFLILVGRPLATMVVTLPTRLDLRERAMLSWAGLRGAIPIWLATFPVVAGVAEAELIFNVVFFIVVTSTLLQGATIEPLAGRLGLTTSEPALPRRLLESGRIRRMGGDVIAYRLRPGAAAAGHLVRELDLPREALVNVIVRDGRAIPPRGSTELREGDELHVLVSGGLRNEVEALTRRWHEGPVGTPPPPSLPRRAASQVFSVRPATGIDDPSSPGEVDGIPVAKVLRTRRDRSSALVALVDGRYAVTTESVVAVGGRQALARWCERRAQRSSPDDATERAWWQEAIGVLIAWR